MGAEIMCSNMFIFNACHNGITCILSTILEEQGTSKQYRFTASMLAECFGAGVDTIRRRIETLMNTGDIDETQNCVSSQMPYSNGSLHDVTLYDLDVFNKLAMTFIDNPRAVEIREKFNDVIVKHETRQYEMPQDFVSALRAYANEIEAKERVQRALEAEKEAHEKDNRDFCEGLSILEKKKAEIGSRREATAMNTASQKSRECKRLENENEGLREQIGDSKRLKSVKCISWLKEFFYKDGFKWNTTLSIIGKEIKKICLKEGYECKQIEDPNWGKVFAYDIRAIEIFKAKLISDKNFMRKYRVVNDAMNELRFERMYGDQR